jgi:polyhydroxyalkanoate synthesis regulator phasin
MAPNPLLKKLIDAGAQFTETSQASAERLVSELQKAGGVRRKEAEKAVQTLVERGRQSSEQLISTIQSEVAKQLGRFADRIEELETQLQDLAAKVGITNPPSRARRASTTSTAGTPAEPSAPAPAPKAAKRSSATKATTAKAVTAPKAAKVTPATSAKPATAKSAKPAASAKATKSAKQAAGSSGVAKVAAKKAAQR